LTVTLVLAFVADSLQYYVSFGMYDVVFRFRSLILAISMEHQFGLIK